MHSRSLQWEFTKDPGAKHGNQRCNPFVHIGWPDDHVRGVLGALVVHPTGRWSEVVTARQIPCKNGHDAHFRIDGRSAAAGAICALRHSGNVDLARLWCAFRTPDAVSSGHLSEPTPQGGRRRTAARDIRGLRCIRLRCDTGDAWLRFSRPPIQRRSLHHCVDDRLLYGRFRLRDRARCHYATTNGSVGAAHAALAADSTTRLAEYNSSQIVDVARETIHAVPSCERYRAWLSVSTTMKTGVLSTGTPANKDEPVGHRFTVENGLIRRMEVSSLPSP